MSISSLSVQKLTNRHRLMMDALVFEGLTGNQICDRFGIVPSRLSVLRNSPLWIEEEGELRSLYLKENLNSLQEALPDAVQALKDTVVAINIVEREDGSKSTVINAPETRIRSAREILDRGGIFKKEVEKPTVQIGKIDSLKIELKESETRQDSILKELHMTKEELIEGVIIEDDEEIPAIAEESEVQPEVEDKWWEEVLG